MDATEKLLWTMMGRFEALAVDRYAETAPGMLTARKQELVRELRAAAPEDGSLGATDLAGPIDELLSSARGRDESETLLLQGLLFEPLGRAIYKLVREVAGLSPRSRALAELGEAASAEVCERAALLVEERLGAGEALFASFATATRPALAHLDAIGEALDVHFAEKLNLRFADLLGEVTAELLPICTGLGMNRRKVVCHLTTALMGAG